MRNYLDHNDLISELLLLRGAFPGTLLVVEGSDDSKLFERFIDHDHCRTVVGHGKEAVIGAILSVEDAGFEGLIGVVDADDWLLTGEVSPSKNLLVTDLPDIELMILSSGALGRVRRELLSSEKVADFLSRHGETNLLAALLSRTRPVAILRWISRTYGLNLRFHSIDISEYLSRDTLEVDVDRLVQRVLQETSNPKLKTEKVCKMLMVALGDAELPDSLVCCGHDVVAVLAVGMRKALATRGAQQSDPDDLARVLRLAYELRDFVQTNLYASIGRWEEANAPYRVLLSA